MDPHLIKVGRDVVERDVFCLKRLRFSTAVIVERLAGVSLLSLVIDCLETVEENPRGVLVMEDCFVRVDGRVITEEAEVVEDCVVGAERFGGTRD